MIGNNTIATNLKLPAAPMCVRQAVVFVKRVVVMGFWLLSEGDDSLLLTYRWLSQIVMSKFDYPLMALVNSDLRRFSY